MEDNIADSLALGPEPGQSDASYLQPEALNLIAQTFSYNNVGGKIFVAPHPENVNNSILIVMPDGTALQVDVKDLPLEEVTRLDNLVGKMIDNG